MNKRARLARRILREHRAGINFHHERGPGGVRYWSFWACPHCPRRHKLIPLETPRAYR